MQLQAGRRFRFTVNTGQIYISGNAINFNQARFADNNASATTTLDGVKRLFRGDRERNRTLFSAVNESFPSAAWEDGDFRGVSPTHLNMVALRGLLELVGLVCSSGVVSVWWVG